MRLGWIDWIRWCRLRRGIQCCKAVYAAYRGAVRRSPRWLEDAAAYYCSGSAGRTRGEVVG